MTNEELERKIVELVLKEIQVALWYLLPLDPEIEELIIGGDE